MLLKGTLEVTPALILRTRYRLVMFKFLWHSSLCFVCVQDGRTALFYAAMNGHSNVVCVLVEAHADLNLPDKV